MLTVSLLGDFRIRINEAPISGIDTPRLQSLLAYLVLHRDAPQSRAHLAFIFWPDTSETQARTNLRNLLHNLRHTLPIADAYLETGVQTLQWRSDAPFSLDVVCFETALTHAKQTVQRRDSANTRDALAHAVTLYTGDLLPSCYDDWIIPQREALRQVYLNALEELVSILEEQRDYRQAIEHAQQLLRYDPLHEATYRHLIRLHALNDDRAGALRIYHTCTTTLLRELNVEPSKTTQEAYEQLLGVNTNASPIVTIKAAFSPMVGREVEWAQLLQAWRTVVAGGEAHVVMLSGEAGIGKTRLVEDLLQWAARQGIASASARCYAAEGELAFAPVTAWLRTHPLTNLDDIWLTEVARLVPEILTARPDLPKPMPLTETWQRQRLFEALSHAILGKNQPLLLTIDDLQWCDRDTLEWLHFLLRFDRNAHLLIVGAYRPEEIELDHPLVATLQALRLEGQVNEVELRPLDEAATQTLATLVAGVEITNETASILYHETEGNPLFVVETVRAGLPSKDQKLIVDKTDKLTADSGLANLDLPPKVHSVLTARLAQLSTPSRQLAELAATIGREFSFKLLTKASGWDEDTLVHQLDELWQRRIVREMGIEAYDFSHDKLREVAYHSMSAARRQLLHRHTAQALEKLHAANPDPVSHQVAAHYERAGLSGQAATYYLRAARVASQIFANKEAITLLHRGLELVKEKEPGTSDDENRGGVATQLWEKLGDILTLTAQQTEALQAYQNGLTLVPPTDQIWKARLHRKVGAVMQEQRHYSDELEACQKAEAALGKQPEVDIDPWWEEWLEVQVEQVWAHYWLAQWPEMEALVNKVQPVVQAHGTIANQMRFRMASCLLHLRKERYVVSDQMLAYSREALEASRELGYIRAQVDCQFELGFLLLWRKEFEEAEELLQATYELTKISGIMPQRTLSLTYLTVLYRFQEKLDETLEQAHRAQETAEVAHMPDYVAAAKGNQAWVAWRRQEFQTAQQMAEEALKLWQQSPLVYPFQWQALWPLIGVAMRRGEEAAAWAHIKALLEPMQQKLPDRLNDLLESALQAQAKQQDETSYINMEQAMTVAQQLGYL